MKSANENKDLKQKLNQEIKEQSNTVKNGKGKLKKSMEDVIHFLEGIVKQFTSK